MGIQLDNINENQFLTFLQGRRSLRRYDGRPIPKDVVQRLLDAAAWAPSAHNRQPWRYCVVQDRAITERLSSRMADQWRKDLGRDGVSKEVIERRASISHTRMMTAGLLIIPSVTMEDMDEYPDSKRANAEWIMAVQSVSLSCQNLLLAVHHENLGACWMCAPLFVPELVRDVLELPSHWHPQAMITVGYPLPGHTAIDKTKTREPLNSWVVWR